MDDNYRIPKKKTSTTGNKEADLQRSEGNPASADDPRHSRTQTASNNGEAQLKAGNAVQRPGWLPSTVHVVTKPPGMRFDRKPEPTRGKPRPRPGTTSPAYPQRPPDKGRASSRPKPPQDVKKDKKVVKPADPVIRPEKAKTSVGPQRAGLDFGRLHELEKSAQGSQVHRWVAEGGSHGPTVTIERDMQNLRREVQIEANRFLRIGSVVELTLYTDGGCFHNGLEDAVAAAAVFHRNGSALNHGEVLPLRHRQTNNTAEIVAAIMAIKRATQMTDYKRICIITDSKLLADGWTSIPYWETNGWKRADGQPVRNRAQFKELEEAVAKVSGLTLRFVLVPGHSGNPGNTAAHNLADAALRRHEARVNEARYAEDPEAPRIKYIKSTYGGKQKEEVAIPQPTASSIRKDIVLNADLQRSMKMKQVLDKSPEQVPEKDPLFTKEEIKANDLRNKLVIKRKSTAPGHGEPAQKKATGGDPWRWRSPGKTSSGSSASSSSETSSSSEDSSTGRLRDNTYNDNKVQTPHLKKMARKQQLELKLATLGEDHPRAPQIIQQLIEEEIRRDTRRQKIARKAERRRSLNREADLRHLLLQKTNSLSAEDLAALNLNAPIGPEGEEREFWEDQLDYDAESVQASSPDADRFIIDEGSYIDVI